MDDLSGHRVGRFEILHRLGAGGMGEVWEAKDTELRRRVALKRLAPTAEATPDARRRLIQEARNAARVQHQGVAALYDVIQEDDQIWLVLELVEGRTLKELDKPLPVDTVIELGLQAARALEAAHDRGVVHGDIKPANLMVQDDGTLKLLDFGVAGLIATAREEATTTPDAGQAPGSGWTPAYAAPEVLRQEASDHRADLFALGLVLFEACAGHHPFDDQRPMGVVSRILSEPTPYPSRATRDVPPELERIILRLLEKSPDDRYPDATGVCRDLEELRASRSGSPGGGAIWQGWPPIVAAILLVVVAVWIGPWRSSPGPTGETVAGEDFDAADWVIGVWPDTEADSTRELAAVDQGLASTITARLARLSRERGLQVVPARSLREANVDSLDGARRQLGVTLAVSVASRRMGQRLRVTTSLVDVAAHRQIFADIVTGSMDDLMDLEERVASSVLRMLRVELRPAEPRRVGAGTEVTDAYNAYLLGEGYLADFNDEIKLDAAIDLFQRAVRADPEYAAAHAALGTAFVYRFRLSEDPEWIRRAAQECRRAIELDDLSAEARVCMGKVHDFRGEPTAAAESFARAASLDPTLDTAFIGLADAYADQDRADLAEETYREAISIRPHYWAGYQRLGTFLLRRGRVQEALDAFRKVVELAPASFVGHRDLGTAYFMADRWDEARARFEKALEIHPRDRRTLNNLATLQFFQERYAEAARTYERAVELNPRDPLLWGNVGDAYYWAPGERPEARAAYRRAIELCRRQLEVNPRDPQLLSDLAYYLAMVGDEGEARKNIALALELSPEDVIIRSTAAKVHHVLGDTEAALAHLEFAIAAGESRDMFRSDPLFRDLRGDPRFERLTGPTDG